MLLAGTVSAISWYVPLMLGAIPQLNYVVPAEVILVSYALLLIAVSTLIQAAIVFLVGRVFDTRHFRPEQNEHVARIVRAGLALICGSLFMTKATDYGEAFVESATSSCWCTQSFFAPKAADLKPASSPGDSTPVFPVLSSSNRTRELLEILRSLLCGRTKVSRNEFPAVKERFRRTVGSGCARLPASPGDGKRSSLLDRQVLIHVGFDCIRILRLKADLNRRKIIVACAGRKRGAGLEFASEETAFLVVQPM